MNRVVEILMKRDGLTETEANTWLADVRSEIDDALADNDYQLVEDIIYSELSLEMDYVVDIMCL